MTRSVFFFIDTVDADGNHHERYLSIQYHEGEIPLTTKFFDEVLRYFNYGCDGCTDEGYRAVDITRIVDNGNQIYFDSKESIEGYDNGSHNRG